MSLTQVVYRKSFHKLFIECLSQQRQPTEEEIDLIAGEIWRSSHGCVTGQPWADVARGSDSHRQMMNAARAALGVHSKQLRASNDEQSLVTAA
ncbi:hypothetical protein [Sphingobium fuliginis]|uniref:Uncharacterized protein n=1 Tax=Sphingobium fuliginis (strain ATCC 27551) TaxID=336203 RepID=A0ABQ1F063_SPHSA|nr:hypothetical protein [Sphingobium fuliginis]RYL97654.1 hypothetical protein EWH10_14010 [Sphingobium fuliginis]GFZ93904.1 hypothetical protein GCM10019071_25230 [Sphingobium fuliginis]